MATAVMASMSSLSFAASGARAGRVAPAYGLAPRRHALAVRAQTEVRLVCVSLTLSTFPQF
jgi:hypothetical protein